MRGILNSDIVAILVVFFILLPRLLRKINDIDWRERLFFLSKILLIIAFLTYVGFVIYDFLTIEEITKTMIIKTVAEMFTLMYCYWKLYFLRGKELHIKEKLKYCK